MSYEYARMPLKPGLNMICGPNGSGKSAILLALSVALGQTYTERSRKLSNLIRWGKDVARITLVFNNTVSKGRRPFPKYRTDDFHLSRYLRKDGTYWYEANFRAIDKTDVVRLLSGLGVNPDNMLIIMHQNMVEEFALTTPQRKLEMVEEAVGLGEYRDNIIESRARLSKILGEEESVRSLFEGAEQTLEYWKTENEKYQRWKQLSNRKQFLEKELFWSQLIEQEKLIELWVKKTNKKRNEFTAVVKKLEATKNATKKLKKRLDNLNYDQRKSFFSLLQLEKEKTEVEVKTQIYKQMLQEMSNPLSDMKELKNYFEKARTWIKTSKDFRNDLNRKIKQAEKNLLKTEDQTHHLTEDYIDKRVDKALLNYKKEILEKETREYSKELAKTERELVKLRELVEKNKPRIETTRSPLKVTEEGKLVNAHIISLGKISEDAEKMFFNYSKIYEDIKRRTQTLSENRTKALQEVEIRIKVWRKLIKNILDNMNPTYQDILSKIGAIGSVRLIKAEDVETAGLELIVGFKGASPTILDAYTQSGGERSTATIAFLLALQQHIKSPIRGVDEFDVHMDPRNREIITQTLLTSTIDRDYQYITITPGQLSSTLNNAHVITVQKTSGKSEVKTVI